MAKVTRTYRWNGTDRAGKRISGVTIAAGESALRAELWRQGIVPSRIRRSLLKGAGRVRSEEITAATRQLATMIGAGIPLVQAFDIIGNSQDTPAVQALLLRVKNDIEGGTALSAALARYPRHFDDLYVNLVAAGEQAGALEALLAKIAAYREKTQSIKSKIRKALFYPAAVTAVALLVTVILLVFVIPEFESLFAGFGAELPALTLMVIGASDFVRTSGWTLGFMLTIAQSRSSRPEGAPGRCAIGWSGRLCASRSSVPSSTWRPRRATHARSPSHSPPAHRSCRRWNLSPGPPATSSTKARSSTFAMRSPPGSVCSKP